jgi:hypothetical protein
VYKVDLQIPGRRLSTMTGTLGGFAARPAAPGNYRIVREAKTVRILLPAGVTAGHYGVFDLGGRLVRVLVPFSAQCGQLECAWEQGSAQTAKTSCGWYVVRPLAAGAAPAAAVAVFR